MSRGKSIRIYLADGNVTGIRHGEIVNWTGQAVMVPRKRYAELKGWSNRGGTPIYPKKSDLVAVRYEIPVAPVDSTVAVKVIDMVANR